MEDSRSVDSVSFTKTKMYSRKCAVSCYSHAVIRGRAIRRYSRSTFMIRSGQKSTVDDVLGRNRLGLTYPASAHDGCDSTMFKRPINAQMHKLCVAFCFDLNAAPLSSISLMELSQQALRPQRPLLPAPPDYCKNEQPSRVKRTKLSSACGECRVRKTKVRQA